MPRADRVLDAVHEMAHRFLRMRDWRCVMESVLAQLGAAAEVEQVYQYRIEATGSDTLAWLEHTWTSPAIDTEETSERVRRLVVSAPGFQGQSDALRRGETIWGNLVDLPEDWRAALAPYGLRSMLTAPVFVQGRWWGVLGFCTYSREYDWTPAMASAFRAAADILGSAIERTDYEESLRRSEARYRGIIESQRDLVIRMSPDDRFTYVNDAFCRVFCVRREDILGRSFVGLVHPDDLQRTREALHKIQQPPFRNRLQNRVITPDGPVWLLWEGYAIRNENGDVVELQGVGRNISDLKRAEEALSRSQEAYRELVETIPVGICRFDAKGDGRILAANPAAARMFGFDSTEEFLGATVDDIHADATERKRLRALALQHGQLVAEPMKMRQKDGSHFWVRGTGTINRVENGVPRDVSLLLEDITERMLAEQKLIEQEELYRSLFEGSVDGIGFVDEQGWFVDCNQAFLDMLGYTRDELRTMDFYQITPEKWHEWERKEIVERRLKPFGFTGTYEKEYIRKDGTVFPVELTSYRLDGTDTRPTMFWGVARDITERKQAERAMKSVHHRMMMARDEERRRLAVELHDSLGQSLVVLQMTINSTLTNDGGLDPPAREALESASIRCKELVNEVRCLCSGLYPKVLESLGLCAALRGIVRDTPACVQATLLCPDDLEGRRFASDVELAMYRIAQEAFHNALRHANPQNVLVRLQLSEQTLMMSVENDGLPFQPDFHADKGLGMTSMRERAEAIGGAIDITSDEHGTAVRVHVPL